jgi:transcriptional regulator with XRE-family HTH domain
MAKLRTSYRFRARLKLHKLPAYQIAQHADVDPATLSKLVHGAIAVKPGDERVIAVGRILGLEPEDCFERIN